MIVRIRFLGNRRRMSSNITTPNGVRILTVVVLSGSLFLLIYHIGRRRLEQQAPKPDSPRETSLTGRSSKASEGHLKRYFIHHSTKSYPGVSSIAEAVDSSKSSPSTSHEQTGTARRYGTYDVTDETSTGSDISDAETDNPYMFSSTDAALRYNLENRAKKLKAQLVTEAEQSFLDHLQQRSVQETPSSFARPNSPGDLSSFEKIIKDQIQDTRQKDQAECSSSRALKNALETVATEKSRDHGILPREHILPETRREIPYHPTMTLAKPLLYCFMWCILSHSFSLFNRRGVGAKMVTFPAPFFRNTMHLIIQTLLACCMLQWPMKKFFYNSWTTFLWRVIPVAIAATMDHEPQAGRFSNICGNLKVPVSDLLACKSGGPLTHLGKTFGGRMFAVVCHVEDKCKAWVPLIAFLLATGLKLDGQGHNVFSNVLIISVGFMLAAYKEEEIESWSLIKLSTGSVVSAFRLAATQNLLQNRAIGLVSPVVTMRALAPVMASVTAVFSYFVDPWSNLRESEFFNTPERSLLTNRRSIPRDICGHRSCHYSLDCALAELVVIYHTSANTMIIVDMLKEVALLTIHCFHDHDYTRLNAIGVGVFCVGVLSYTSLRYRKMMENMRFQTDGQPTLAMAGEEGSWSASENSLFPADFFARTKARIWTEVSIVVDRVLQVNGSCLRIIGRAWTDGFGLFRRFLRQ